MKCKITSFRPKAKNQYGRLEVWKTGSGFLSLVQAVIRSTPAPPNAGVIELLPTANCQLPTVNRQPSTVNRQPSTVNRQPSTPSTVCNIALYRQPVRN